MKSKKSMYSHLLDATLEVEKKLNDSLEETCLQPEQTPSSCIIIPGLAFSG